MVNPVAKVLREGKIVGLANHTILISRNGSEIPIDDSASPILDDLGQITGTVLVFQDVSERRQKEAQLRRIEWMLAPKVRPPVVGEEARPASLWRSDRVEHLATDPRFRRTRPFAGHRHRLFGFA